MSRKAKINDVWKFKKDNVARDEDLIWIEKLKDDGCYWMAPGYGISFEELMKFLKEMGIGQNFDEPDMEIKEMRWHLERKGYPEAIKSYISKFLDDMEKILETDSRSD